MFRQADSHVVDQDASNGKGTRFNSIVVDKPDYHGYLSNFDDPASPMSPLSPSVTSAFDDEKAVADQMKHYVEKMTEMDRRKQQTKTNELQMEDEVVTDEIDMEKAALKAKEKEKAIEEQAEEGGEADSCDQQKAKLKEGQGNDKQAEPLALDIPDIAKSGNPAPVNGIEVSSQKPDIQSEHNQSWEMEREQLHIQLEQGEKAHQSMLELLKSEATRYAQQLKDVKNKLEASEAEKAQLLEQQGMNSQEQAEALKSRHEDKIKSIRQIHQRKVEKLEQEFERKAEELLEQRQAMAIELEVERDKSRKILAEVAQMKEELLKKNNALKIYHNHMHAIADAKEKQQMEEQEALLRKKKKKKLKKMLATGPYPPSPALTLGDEVEEEVCLALTSRLEHVVMENDDLQRKVCTLEKQIAALDRNLYKQRSLTRKLQMKMQKHNVNVGNKVQFEDSVKSPGASPVKQVEI